ncbi:MAG: D-alanyl-D-alanine carboxypeptidase, partial [Bacteroidia bacterium]|nr:D-alanyl-D-alanine carboxypeptidase [Bacteroidia bacterium]
MKRLIIILAAFISVQAAAQNAVQQYIEQLKGTDELKEAVWGIKAVKLGGGTVAEYNSRTRMMPASNMKLITTGLALNGLGSDYRFRTGIAYSGGICDGVLDGDLYIVGGGDPTLGDRDSVAVELKETFSQWEKMIRDAGITRIEGRIIGDGRWFEGESQNWSWMLEDCAGGDGAAMSALSFGGGLQSFTVSPGARIGDPVKVEAVF